MAYQQILFGRGDQPWVHVPSDHLGVPTRVDSASYTISDTSVSTSSAERIIAGPTTVDADDVSTTLAAAGGRATAYASQLSVVSSTGIEEGRRYLLVALTGGDREIIVPRQVGVGSVSTVEPVKGIYESGSALVGIELTATFPAEVADDEDRLVSRDFQVVWTYTINGREFLAPERISVGRYSMVPWIGPDYLLAGRTSLQARVKPNEVHGALLSATRKVAGELEASDIPPENYRPTEMGRIAVMHYALHVLYSNFSGAEDVDRAEAELAAYKTQIHQLVQGKSQARVLDQGTDVSRPVYSDYKIFRLP